MSWGQKVAAGDPTALAQYNASPQGQQWANSNTNKFLQGAGLDYSSQQAAKAGAGNPQAQAAVQGAFGQLSPQQQWQLAGTGQGSNAGYMTGMFGGFLGNNNNQLASWINNNAYSNTPGSQGYGSFAGAQTPGPSGTIGYSGTPLNPGGPGGTGGGTLSSPDYSGSGTAGGAVGNMLQNPGQGMWDPSVKPTYDQGQTGDYLGSYGGQYYGQGNVPSAANGWGTGIPNAPPGSTPNNPGANPNATGTTTPNMYSGNTTAGYGTGALPPSMFSSAAQQNAQTQSSMQSGYGGGGSPTNLQPAGTNYGTQTPGLLGGIGSAAQQANPGGGWATSGMGMNEQSGQQYGVNGNLAQTNPQALAALEQARGGYPTPAGGYATQPQQPQTMGIGNYINQQRAAPSYFPQ